MSEIQKVIGLMSGTSLDGIDAALLETDGMDVVRQGEALTLPYDPETRAMLHEALMAAQASDGATVPLAVRDAEQPLTYAHGVAVKALLSQAGLRPGDIALIGFHGQTVLHRPAQHLTWQIGDGALLARMTGVDVVNDFRSADVAAGGQGAPLVPLYHAALVQCASSLSGPVVVANIGGVANVTYVDGDTILAFDTGPGNAPLDDWMMRHTGAPIDEDGATAARGVVDQARLGQMLDNAYFRRPPPKSLDRQDFGTTVVNGLSLEDGAATLTAFTAAALGKARDHFPKPAGTWIVCGGGRHNHALMAHLRSCLGGEVLSADTLGWRGDFIEAEAFAYLAARSKAGLPLSLPTTTGVKTPLTGGKLHKK